jgi:hypothetical protein
LISFQYLQVRAKIPLFPKPVPVYYSPFIYFDLLAASLNKPKG